MDIKEFVKRCIGIGNYDRQCEAKIKKYLSLYKKGGKLNRWRAQRMFNQVRHQYNVCIYPQVQIGKNLYIAHGHDIMIGRTAIIGDNCRIYPSFCVIAAVKGDEDLKGQRRHAKIGNDCLLGAKATIIGNATIGDDVTIGAGAMITKDVPSHSVVKGVNQIRPKRKEEIPMKYHSVLGLNKE